MLEVNGPRKRGRPKMTLGRQVEESVKKVGLKMGFAEGMRCIRQLSVTRKKPD